MTTPTKQQVTATWRLHYKHEGNIYPKSFNSFTFVCGGQMTINVGIECAYQLDIRKYNNAAMERAIDDFFIVRYS